MRHMILLCSALVLILTASLGVATSSMGPNTGFSGTWLLDTEKSRGLPSGMHQVMTVVRNGNVINIRTKLINQQGEQTVTDVYKVNGRETEFSAAASGGATSKGRRVARWTTDGMGIEVIEVSTINTSNGQMTIETARRWTLSRDGKSLTINIRVKGPQGTQENRRSFVRKL